MCDVGLTMHVHDNARLAQHCLEMQEAVEMFQECRVHLHIGSAFLWKLVGGSQDGRKPVKLLLCESSWFVKLHMWQVKPVELWNMYLHCHWLCFTVVLDLSFAWFVVSIDSGVATIVDGRLLQA